jgi:hypothetical protein
MNPIRENREGKRRERPPERRRQRSGVLGGSGRPEPGSLPPFARPRGRPRFVLGPLEFDVIEAGSAVTRTVTDPVTPQTTWRYAAFPRKSRLVSFLAPLRFPVWRAETLAEKETENRMQPAFPPAS